MFRTVSKLLAGCGPSEERNEQYPKWNFLQGMTDMLHNKRRKSKGENHASFKDLHARNDARKLFATDQRR